jgi:plasmid stabilization system protein ParE
VKGYKRHRAFEADLREAARRYEAAVPGLGSQFVDAVEATTRRIIDSPRAWSRVPGVPEEIDVRRCLLARFPYYVPYLVADSGEIFVLGVAHGKRRPGFWLPRVPSRGGRRS